MEKILVADFQVPGKVPSYNAHFKINYNLKQIYLTPKARNFKRNVKIYSPGIVIADNVLLILEIQVIQSWLYKNKKLKREDCQNMDKLLIDALCNKLGIDDSRIQKSSIEKIHSETEQYANIKVWTIDELPSV